jgi:hypothetical protein
VTASTSRKLAQPFVPQKGRPAAWDRRRWRRIATDRPATDAVVVRVIMNVFWFLPAGAAARSCAFAACQCVRSATARCREPERMGCFLGPERRGSEWGSTEDATTG